MQQHGFEIMGSERVESGREARLPDSFDWLCFLAVKSSRTRASLLVVPESNAEPLLKGRVLGRLAAHLPIEGSPLPLRCVESSLGISANNGSVVFGGPG